MGVSIPYRYATNTVITQVCPLAFVPVSIPYRYATNKTFNRPGDGDRLVFQSLIGTLQT